jgi:hypothetical protein
MTDRKIAFRCIGADGGIAVAGRATTPWIIPPAATMMERRPARNPTNKRREAILKTKRPGTRPAALS